MAAPQIPRNLEAAAREEGRQWWLSTLAATVEDLQHRWSLRLGLPFQPGGQTAWVAPARGPNGEDLVLKLAWRHTEAAHEADALGLWDGHGAIRLYAVEHFEQTIALLMERCRPGTTLAARPEEEQDVVVAGLLRRLWRNPPPGHPFRPLATMCQEWADSFDGKAATGRAGIDPGLARDGIELFRALPAGASENMVLCTDLHAENILAARREPWLAIDPKPYVGDPAYDLLQHLLNCPTRLRSDPRGLCRRMAALTGQDPERVLLWLFARCVQESPDWPELANIARLIAPR
jgi:streptomycin 6-kinase